MTEAIERNKTFSGCDMVASIDILDSSGNRHSYVLGTLLTLTYSTFQDKKPVRALGNINAKDYVCGPRTIAGSMVFSIFNKHILYELSSVYSGYIMDELPPFDITISFANEYGAKARMALYGVRIISEGQTMSVNDIYTENTYQYFAHDLQYIKDEDRNGISGTVEAIKYGSSIGSSSYSGNDYKVIWSYDSKGSTSGSPEQSAPILLACRTENAVDDAIMGSAALTLNPSQADGTTVITNMTTSQQMSVSNSEFPNQVVYVPLEQGQYSAVYGNGVTGESSNEIQFSIGLRAAKQTYIPAPLILQRYGTSIKVKVNCSSHTQLKYGKTGDNTVYSTATVTGDVMLLTGLEQNTAYTIYSCNDDSESQKVIVATKDSSTEMFNFLGAMIANNSELIESPSADTVLTEAKNVYDSMNDGEYSLPFSVADSLAQIKSDAIDQLPDADSQIAASLQNVISACNEISDIVVDTANAENRFINLGSETMFTSQPAMTNSFGNVSLPSEISKVIICNPLEGMVAEGVAKNAAECRSAISMLPQGKYSMIATDKSGIPSPYAEFIVLSDAEKTAKYNKQTLLATDYMAAREAARQQLESTNREFVTMDNESQSRVLMEASTIASRITVCDPAVLESNTDKIVAQVNIYDANLDFYLALCRMDKAIINKVNFKQRIEHEGYTEIVFESENYGLVEGETYCLWIEDQNQQRVTGIVTTKIGDTESDAQINAMLVSMHLNSMKEKISATLDYARLSELMAAVYSDESTNRLNIYDKAIEKAIQMEPNMTLRDAVIGCILQLKYRYKEDLSRGYVLELASNIVRYKRGSYVSQTAYAASMRTVEYADDECVFTSESVEQTAELQPAIGLNEYVYIMMKEQGAAEYAGFVLINCRTGSETHYKINVREVA